MRRRRNGGQAFANGTNIVHLDGIYRPDLPSPSRFPSIVICSADWAHAPRGSAMRMRATSFTGRPRKPNHRGSIQEPGIPPDTLGNHSAAKSISIWNLRRPPGRHPADAFHDHHKPGNEDGPTRLDGGSIRSVPPLPTPATKSGRVIRPPCLQLESRSPRKETPKHRDQMPRSSNSGGRSDVFSGHSSIS